MKTLTTIRDNYGPYIGKIIRKDNFLFPGGKYYLEVQRNDRDKIKKIKIGKDGMISPPPYPFLYGININNLEFNQKGIEVKITEISNFGDIFSRKTFLIPRKKFPK